MNELMKFAIDAVALLAPLTPYLSKAGESAAEKLGEAGYEKVKAIYLYIKKKFASDGDEYALQTLTRLEEQPTNDGRKGALANTIADKAETDSDFANELSRLVEEAKQDKNVTQFLTNVYGNAQVGKIFNIGQVDHIIMDD